MKQIKKYNNQKTDSNFASKLASYSVMAAAVMACPMDAAAQCGIASAGAPLGVDIDGDGVADVTLNVANFPGPYLLASGTYSTALPNFTTTTVLPQTFTITAPGPGTSFNGCITTLTNGAFTAIVPYATATSVFDINYTTIFYNQSFVSYYAIAYSVNVAYATGAAIIGLTASGASICPSTAGGAIVPGTNLTYLGTQFCYFSSYYAFTIGGVYYAGAVATPGSFTLDAPPCTTSLGFNYYAGFMQTLNVYGSFAVGYSGPYLLGTPASGTNTLGCATIPGNTFIGVQFVGGDGDTYNGWVEVMFNADGTVTCVDNGYQMCSIESATAVGTPSFSCIPVGTATNSNAACDVPECDADAGAWPAPTGN